MSKMKDLFIELQNPIDEGYEEWLAEQEKKDLEHQMAEKMIEDLNEFFSAEADYIINK
jgi:plasmid maintenance system antidote protein VapI